MPLFTPDLSEEELLDELGGVGLSDFERIAEGGQGSVWRCTYNRQDSALKIYPLTHIHRTRVDREIDALRRLNCDEISSLHHYDQIVIRDDLHCIYYVTDFVEGHNLRQILLNRSLNQDECSALILDMSSAIEELWDLRIIHRDIKPENIILSNDGFKLIDLGIAKFLEEPTFTPTNHTLGTLGYMSPEQYSARKGLTLRSDYFSLGIVAYEAITGTHPFYRRQDLIGKADFPEFDSDLEVNTNLRNCIYALLGKKIYNRPNSQNEIIELLGE